MKKVLRILLTLVCCCIIGFCGWKLYDYLAQNERTRRVNEENAALIAAGQSQVTQEVQAADMTPTATPAVISASPLPTSTLRTIYSLSGPTPVPTAQVTQPPLLSSLKALQTKYPDVVGYLKAGCITRIDFAVVQKDNSYYMSHDLTGAQNVTGAAFLDENCDVWPRSENLIIYGHNMKSGEIFGELNRMANTTTLAKDPLVQFSTLYDEGTYAPLFIGSCSVSEVPFYKTSFRNESDFDSFLSVLRDHSQVKLETEAVYGDDLLTLVTCVDGDEDHRFVVIMRKVRDGESLDEVKRSIFPM